MTKAQLETTLMRLLADKAQLDERIAATRNTLNGFRMAEEVIKSDAETEATPQE